MLGFLAVAGGFGLALGLTMVGMNALINVMPSKRKTEQKGSAAQG
jgi:hypothetical protein